MEASNKKETKRITKLNQYAEPFISTAEKSIETLMAQKNWPYTMKALFLRNYMSNWQAGISTDEIKICNGFLAISPSEKSLQEISIELCSTDYLKTKGSENEKKVRFIFENNADFVYPRLIISTPQFGFWEFDVICRLKTPVELSLARIIYPFDGYGKKFEAGVLYFVEIKSSLYNENIVEIILNLQNKVSLQFLPNLQNMGLETNVPVSYILLFNHSDEAEIRQKIKDAMNTILAFPQKNSDFFQDLVVLWYNNGEIEKMYERQKYMERIKFIW